MEKLVYSRQSHSLNRHTEYTGCFFLTIGFVELIVNSETNEVIDARGFLPLIKASRSDIEVPKCTQKGYNISLAEGAKIRDGQVYDYLDVVDNGKKYFERYALSYDEANGIICIGNINYSSTDFPVEVNRNMVCVADCYGSLKSIYIIPDVYVM